MSYLLSLNYVFCFKKAVGCELFDLRELLKEKRKLSL